MVLRKLHSWDAQKGGENMNMLACLKTFLFIGYSMSQTAYMQLFYIFKNRNKY